MCELSAVACAAPLIVRNENARFRRRYVVTTVTRCRNA